MSDSQENWEENGSKTEPASSAPPESAPPKIAGVDGTLFKARRWNVHAVKKHRIFYLLGRRGSGKSTLLDYLLYQFRDDFDVVIAMSGTMDTVRMLEKHMPLGTVYNYYDLEKIEDVVNYLEELDMENKPLPRVGIILDDCMWDKKILQSNVMRKIHMNGRHWNITFFNCVQYLMDCPTWVRTNVDYLFAFWDNNMKNRENLQKFFFGMLKMDEFELTFRHLTGGKRCIVVDSTEDSADLSKQIYHFKASPDVPPFTLGSRGFWKFGLKLIHEAEARNREESSRKKELDEQLMHAKTAALTKAVGGGQRKRKADTPTLETTDPPPKPGKQPRFTGVVALEDE